MTKVERPISPDEADAYRAGKFPAAVVESFNEVIAEHFDGEVSVFRQRLVVEKICAKMGMSVRDGCAKIDEFKWLDVEPVYRRAGWEVEYDKAGPGETDSFFRFRRKAKPEES